VNKREKVMMLVPGLGPGLPARLDDSQQVEEVIQ
jgi:hypothetical protein